MSADKPQVWAVLGPTASGKSAAALELALRCNGEIISCDSVQVYRYFDIGSAKPSPAQRAEVPHHLIDILDPLCLCTAGFWRDAALQAARSVLDRGRVPVIAGGTGLYFKALYTGLFEGASSHPAVRLRLQCEAETEGLEPLYTRLKSVDPAYAGKIPETDRKRIIRALEAFEVSGLPFSELHRLSVKPDWDWHICFLSPERGDLHQRITLRTSRMLEEGLIEETRSLAARFPESPALAAIGYKETLSYLQGGLPSQSALWEAVVLRTRQFAKRQTTLFKNLLKDTPFTGKIP